jgi:hypothetical protein
VLGEDVELMVVGDSTLGLVLGLILGIELGEGLLALVISEIVALLLGEVVYWARS